MKFKEYRVICRRTMNATLPPRLVVPALRLGIRGELGECLDAVKKDLFASRPLTKEKLLIEGGDVTWYLSGLADFFEIESQFVQDRFDEAGTRGPGYRVKDGGEHSRLDLEELEVLHDHCIRGLEEHDYDSLVSAVARFLDFLHIDAGEAMARNVQKLAERYPGGFDALRQGEG